MKLSLSLGECVPDVQHDGVVRPPVPLDGRERGLVDLVVAKLVLVAVEDGVVSETSREPVGRAKKLQEVLHLQRVRLKKTTSEGRGKGVVDSIDRTYLSRESQGLRRQVDDVAGSVVLVVEVSRPKSRGVVQQIVESAIAVAQTSQGPAVQEAGHVKHHLRRQLHQGSPHVANGM